MSEKQKIFVDRMKSTNKNIPDYGADRFLNWLSFGAFPHNERCMGELRFIIPLLFTSLVSLIYAKLGKLINPYSIIPWAAPFGVLYSINLRLNNANICVSISCLLFAEVCLF